MCMTTCAAIAAAGRPRSDVWSNAAVLAALLPLAKHTSGQVQQLPRRYAKADGVEGGGKSEAEGGVVAEAHACQNEGKYQPGAR